MGNMSVGLPHGRQVDKRFSFNSLVLQVGTGGCFSLVGNTSLSYHDDMACINMAIDVVNGKYTYISYNTH